MTSTALTRPSEIRRFLTSRRVRPEVEAVAAPGTNVETIAQAFGVALLDDPELRNCTPASWARAAVEAAHLGLAPVHGHAYLIQYKDQVQLQLGYLGMIELARRSGWILDVRGEVVRGGDTFHYALGLDPRLEHVPVGDSTAEVTHAYAVATWRDGRRTFEVMDRAELDGIRARSQSPKKGPWATDYAEMARKTVIRRICKTLPMTPPPSRPSPEDVEPVSGPFDAYEPAEHYAEVEGVDVTTGEILEAQEEDPQPHHVQAVEIADGDDADLPF